MTASQPQILYEDNHILVAVKKPGLLSQADGSQTLDMLTLLKEDIRQRYQKPGRVFLGLVHRLDQPVGGVMVFARTSKAAGRLSNQIRQHQFEKYYLAVVHGCPEPPSGKLSDCLEKDPARNLVQIVPPGFGKEAWLSYVVVSADAESGLCLLGIRLGTGRPHQIRVQLASRGWPIVGDRRYGLQQQSTSAGKVSEPALFACALGFSHPTRPEQLFFSAAPPAEPPWNRFPAVDLQKMRSLFTEF
ncbi:MAG: RluA family pseudouridine synthase [Bacillota bacterium]|nr:RluA family pseudouridine synthase [Bacillota bacterium]